jgi:hypothetical protein
LNLDLFLAKSAFCAQTLNHLTNRLPHFSK